MKRPVFFLLLALVLTGCALPRGFIPVTNRTPTITPSPYPTTTARPTERATIAENLQSIAATLAPSVCVVENTRGEVLNIRKAPGMDAEIIGGLVPGQRLQVLAWGEDWHMVKAGELVGFVSSKFCIYQKGR